MADTQLIKDRVDIVGLIQEYVPLKKSGANWKAPCPFHHEKSPSFMVHPEKQIWHCFGCGKGGDIFSFVMEMEGIDFVEALQLLAKRAGVQIDTYKSEVSSSQRARILEINSAAANFFQSFLSEMPASQAARDYLEKRGLKKVTIESWEIGFAPDQWELLTKYLIKKGHGIDDLVASGLTIKRDGADAKSGRGFYDRFRGRVMFPIWDAHGSVVGFTGRILVETENSGGKYVNSPQSIVYDKSRVIYGLNKAKTEIKAKDLVVLVEGQMDVIACHQAGMNNVVAASGTALTHEQVKLLKRYTNNLAVSFDADAAGQSAGKRGIEVALEEGMNVSVIQVPSEVGKDADECLQKNPVAWFKAVAGASGIIQWYFETTLPKYNINIPKEKQAAADILLAQIARIPFAVERDDWLKKLSERLNIDLPLLREEIKKASRPAVAKPTDVKVAPVTKAPQSQLESLATEWWSLIVKFPECYGDFVSSLKEDYFRHTDYLILYEQCKNLYNSFGKVEKESLRQFFASPEKENPIDVLELRPYKNFTELSANDAKIELGVILERLKGEWHKQRSGELQRELAAAEAKGDKNKVSDLMQELQIL